jgi:hypothetical protein
VSQPYTTSAAHNLLVPIDAEWDTFVKFGDEKKVSSEFLLNTNWLQEGEQADGSDLWNKHRNLFDLQKLNTPGASQAPTTRRPLGAMSSGKPSPVGGASARPAGPTLSSAPALAPKPGPVPLGSPSYGAQPGVMGQPFPVAAHPAGGYPQAGSYPLATPPVGAPVPGGAYRPTATTTSPVLPAASFPYPM